MSKTIAYIRVSTDRQDLDNQRHEILEYCNAHRMNVDEFIAIEISSRKTLKQRRIEELLAKISGEDTLIVSEMSRLGRSTAEVIAIVNELVKRRIRLIVIKQALDIKGGHDIQSKVMVTLLSLFAELERDIISQRTRDALASKRAKGIRLGRPPGSLGKSKLDSRQVEIVNLLDKKVSMAAIARVCGVSRDTVSNFVKNRLSLKPPYNRPAKTS